MKKRDLGKPAAEISFHCTPCSFTFKAAPSRIDDDPETAHHPYAYFAECPRCNQPAAQASWERALIKAWANSTGPVTPEGKAAVAKNLEGHPTAEEAQRTRFNALQHGLAARTAQYFPAKPDGYAFCSSCDVDRTWCGQQPACVKQTKLFMLHHAAFDQRKPAHLKSVYADLQAGIFALLQQILVTIIGDGVTIRAPQYYTNEADELVIAEYYDDKGEKRIIYDLQAHPLFKPLGELLSRNGLSLSDMGMTSKVIEAEQDELGRLASVDKSRELVTDFMRSTQEALAGMRAIVDRAAAARDQDPVLIEHQQSGEG